MYKLLPLRAKMKKLKKSIQEKEFKTLMNFTQNNPTMRENTKQNLTRLFTLLYYTGMRINEVPTLTIRDMQKGIDNGELIVKAHKQKKERSILLTPVAIKELKKLFESETDPEHKVIKVKANPFTTPSPVAFIARANAVIQSVLGDRYTSHSFRQGLITELGIKGINPKLIQTFIGHKNINTTMNYINPSEADIRNCLVR